MDWIKKSGLKTDKEKYGKKEEDERFTWSILSKRIILNTCPQKGSFNVWILITPDSKCVE